MYPFNNNPYQQYAPNFQQSQNQIIKVNGLDSARAYQTAPNSTVALFDANNDIFYIKSTDAANFPVIRKFRFTEEIDMDSRTAAEYITKDELEAFKEEVLNNVKQLIPTETKYNGHSESNKKQSTGIVQSINE